MRRVIVLAASLVLLVACQTAVAQYGPSGSLTVSTDHPAAGASLTASGTGFAPSSNIDLTIASTPLLLTTATADASGAFSVQVTIPASYLGQHTLSATGTDPQGSVRVLSATITVGASASGTPVSLTDAIAPGVNRGTSGFGTASVILAKPGYVTFLVRLDPSFAGQHVAIYTETTRGDWVYTTGRIVAADGTIHYYRRISAWTGFWAKLEGGSSHGRIGTAR